MGKGSRTLGVDSKMNRKHEKALSDFVITELCKTSRRYKEALELIERDKEMDGVQCSDIARDALALSGASVETNTNTSADSSIEG